MANHVCHGPLKLGRVAADESTVAAHEPARITVLDDVNPSYDARIERLDRERLQLEVACAVPLGTPVKVESDGTVMLGDVCYCQPHAGAFQVGVRLEQAFTMSEDLCRLMRQLSTDSVAAPHPVFVQKQSARWRE